MNPELTAIKRNKASAPLKKFMGVLPSLRQFAGFPKYASYRFIDWGCGRGDDVKALTALGYMVAGYDPYFTKYKENVPELLGPFNVVMCFYVLNVIDNPLERRDILTRVNASLPNHGLLAVATRTHKEIAKAVSGAWFKFSDGWMTSKGTFQRGFSAGEVSSLLVEAGFQATVNYSNSSYTLVVGIKKLRSVK